MFRFRNRGRYHYASRDRWMYVPYSTPVWNRGRERARAYKSRSRPAYSWRIVAHSEAILGPAVRFTSRIGPEKSCSRKLAHYRESTCGDHALGGKVQERG